MSASTHVTSHPLAALIARAAQTATTDVYLAKRREKRLLTECIPVEVRRAGEANQALAGHLVSISVHGLGVTVRERFECRESIELREWSDDGAAEWGAGQVVHVSRGPSGYLIGVRLEIPLLELPSLWPRDAETNDHTTPVSAEVGGAPRSRGGLGWLGALIGAAAVGGIALVWWLERLPT